MDSNYLNIISNRNLLIIDDDEINRGILANIFEDQYIISECDNGFDGLNKILNNPHKYSAILLDVVMPKMNGLEVLKKLNEKAILKDVPVFLITSSNDDDIIKEAYQLGVMDVIKKPIVRYMVLRRVESIVELFESRKRLNSKVISQEKELLDKANKIIELNIGMIEALSTAIEFRNGESGEHVRRIYEITKYIFINTSLKADLKEEDIENIALASIMHDVGKIAIPDAILNKPGKLTKEEYEIMKTHTTKGAIILEKIPQLKESSFFDYAYDIALHHHERYDGNGYPEGLKGEEISIWSQVVSLADVYDALTNKRIYKDAYTADEAIAMITSGQCGIFNPKLLEIFLEVEPEIRKFYKKG